MKHLGLIVAIVLGVVGAAVNWLYLTGKADNFERVAFLSIGKDVQVRRGETFREDHFVAVEIPKANVGRLTERAILYANRSTVVGMKSNLDYEGGELLLADDLKTPPPALEISGDNERVMWVPVDTRTFVPSLVKPGDWVSFLVPKGSVAAAALPASDNGDDSPAPPTAFTDTEMVGPFKVLSVGNRLGSADVFKAAGMPQQQENILSISVRAEGNQLDPKAKKLWDLLQAGGFRQAGVILHPRGVEPK